MITAHRTDGGGFADSPDLAEGSPKIDLKVGCWRSLSPTTQNLKDVMQLGSDRNLNIILYAFLVLTKSPKQLKSIGTRAGIAVCHSRGYFSIQIGGGKPGRHKGSGSHDQVSCLCGLPHSLGAPRPSSFAWRAVVQALHSKTQAVQEAALAADLNTSSISLQEQ